MEKINKYQFANPHVSQGFIGVALNLARMARCTNMEIGMVSYILKVETKDRVKSLLIKHL
jgi:hypothetical protein